MMQEGMAQAAQNKFAPMANYSPAEYDMALVALARSQSLEAITLANATSEGQLMAWEATISFAETLMPMAGSSFLKYYIELRRLAELDEGYPSRALWRVCSLEAKRQKRLGADQVPMDRLKFGVEPQ